MENVLIILNYNDYNNTIKLLNTIKNFEVFKKIIVVDNCSKDNSFILLKQFCSTKIDVIKTNKNCGYAKGNNYGAFYAIEKYNPEFIFISNPDVLFEEPVVRKINAALNIKKEYALATVLVEQGMNVWDNLDFKGTIISLFLISFNLVKYKIRKRILKQKYYSEVGVVEGSFFAIKSHVFQEIGGFDERTFLYYEETILAKKLEKAGYKEIVVTNGRYQHLHSASIQKEYKSKAKSFLNYKLSILLYIKEYLKINTFQYRVFQICFRLALIERYLYDFILRIIKK